MYSIISSEAQLRTIKFQFSISQSNFESPCDGQVELVDESLFRKLNVQVVAIKRMLWKM